MGKAVTEARRVVRCATCNLNQYMTVSGCCRRCSSRLDRPAYTLPEAPETILENPQIVAVNSGESNSDTVANLGTRLRAIRRERGIMMSKKNGNGLLSYSYMSNIERGHMMPTLHSLEKLAEVYGVQLRDFLGPSLLLSDPFVREVAKSVKRLNEVQQKTVLEVLEDRVV